MAHRARIAFVIPRLACGGVETFLLRLCPHLRAAGHDVEIITAQERGEWFDRVAERVPTVHLPGTGHGSGWRHPFRVARFLREREYDLVFPNAERFTQMSLGMLPDRVVAVPICHSDWWTSYRISLASPWAWNALVGVGPKICAVARERRPGKPVVRITSGVELPADEAWQARRRPMGGDLRVIFVGRLVQNAKNVLVLPDIIRQCRAAGVAAHLTVVGVGPDAEALGRLAQEAGVGEAVELVGSVPPEQVIGLLLDHDALLLPSFYEGLPLTLLEAQACGCVPVASRLPGVTDAAVAADQTGFLVPVQSAQGYADALAQLAREPDTWARMSAAGHERAGREFSIARMAEDYRTLIEDALSGRYPLARSRSRGPALDMGLYWRECVPGWAKAVGRRLAGRST